jgi:hypothetical protein
VLNAERLVLGRLGVVIARSPIVRCFQKKEARQKIKKIKVLIDRAKKRLTYVHKKKKCSELVRIQIEVACFMKRGLFKPLCELACAIALRSFTAFLHNE